MLVGDVYMESSTIAYGGKAYGGVATNGTVTGSGVAASGHAYGGIAYGGFADGASVDINVDTRGEGNYGGGYGGDQTVTAFNDHLDGGDGVFDDMLVGDVYMVNVTKAYGGIAYGGSAENIEPAHAYGGLAFGGSVDIEVHTHGGGFGEGHGAAPRGRRGRPRRTPGCHA